MYRSVKTFTSSSFSFSSSSSFVFDPFRDQKDQIEEDESEDEEDWRIQRESGCPDFAFFNASAYASGSLTGFPSSDHQRGVSE